MPGTRFKPSTASEPSASDEASKLELHLQRQLEEDVARIFDESIYSDIEVVCGKLKILTHTCILKTRTTRFYRKLENILHINIGRDSFDEIYSFISDAYTECDIKNQEIEIVTYLNNHLNSLKPNTTDRKIKEDIVDSDVYLTPKCLSPFVDSKFQAINCLSPSTELNKEYYALVPIEGNLLEQELNEQDALSNAFHSIIKTQVKDTNKSPPIQRNKPTTLSLTSSHTSKTVKHANSCDTITNREENTICTENQNTNKSNIVNNTSHLPQNTELVAKSVAGKLSKNIGPCEPTNDKILDPTYSPDSLITDEPSSSSDYLSAAYTFSPGLVSFGCHPQLNVVDNITKMENIFTSSDSGLENTGMLESLSSHKDVTLTDISLTESTLHELTIDDTNQSQDSSSSPVADKINTPRYKIPHTITETSALSDPSVDSSSNGLKSSTPKLKDFMHHSSTKEEKQRQNEEIVILESSSLSSETGSWESVFPPKCTEKEICEKFINIERQQFHQDDARNRKINTTITAENFTSGLVQKSPFKATPCFIDAASLVDEEDGVIKVMTSELGSDNKLELIPMPSQPLPCSTISKPDISPNDWSGSNDNEDSLEQGEERDPDSIQKEERELSPTIFEMTPITEDSLCTFENMANIGQENKKDEVSENLIVKYSSTSTSAVFVSSTPHNSIMSLKSTTLKNYESEGSESDTVIGHDSLPNIRKTRYNESSPIISGGASIEDGHFNQIETRSPITRHKFENTPIVSGSCAMNIGNNKSNKSPKLSSASAWVVDMSSSSRSESERNSASLTHISRKPNDRTCENLKNESKCSVSLENCNRSRSSVDSDSSEKSSHKFYIDLSSLPDPLPPAKNNNAENSAEKKNIFSMYIDLGEKSTVKEMPPRLSSSLNKSSTKSNKSRLSCESTPLSNFNDSTKSTFEKYESLCNDPNISISEIIALPKETPKTILENEQCDEKEFVKQEKYKEKLNSDKRLSHSNKPIEEEELHENDQSADLFVKLSDLDKPLHKPDISVLISNHKEILDVRMTRSIPENNWGDQSTASARSIEVISSFHSENALSLNRLFPHLKNEFSKSMPGSLSGRTRSPLRLAVSSSPGDIDEQVSDVSEISSVQSSMCRSVVENSTTEETSQASSLIGNCQSRLGQDLLRMFLEEIAPDVIVEVSGKRIKAHKCILSSRCQYFAGILSGGWVESAGNVIVLPPFSFNVVHFALCHIYSGVSTIPDSISIVELATIADMLGLEGLKEAIMFTLKAKYCHHFHRPCHVCTAGVLECFPLSSVYGLDDLYRKCLRWITKYFYKVWPTKAFATLPKELLDKCYQEHIVNLSIDNIIDTVCGCGVTVASLQNSRWSESVARMCRRLVNAAAHYAAPRLVAVVRAVGNLAPDTPLSAKQALDDCLAAAIEWAPPDETCRAFAFLSSLVKELRSQHSKPDLITNNQTKAQNILFAHANSWRLQCEGALVRAAPRVVGTQAFKEMPIDLRKRLRELGCIMYGTQAISMTQSPVQEKRSNNRNNKTNNTSISRSLDMEHVRASFVPYASKPLPKTSQKHIMKSSNELHDVKPAKGAHPPKVRTTKAQEERAKYNQTKSNQSHDRLNKASLKVHPFENTKPRYLEPRQSKEVERKPMANNKKLVHKIVSSSESSRNSSPIQARNMKMNRNKSKVGERGHAMSQDSLATSSRPRTAEPSTDSLSESQNSNKYATYTKAKHTSKGSIESIKSSKCQALASAAAAVKSKTKIPVYLNQIKGNVDIKEHKELQKRSNISNRVLSNVAPSVSKVRNKPNERPVSGSLMNATKSSSAKMVSKIIKEQQAKCPTKQGKAARHNSRQEVHEQADIPIMERSGTFLKDEPTFGEKTTNIDIG